MTTAAVAISGDGEPGRWRWWRLGVGGLAALLVLGWLAPPIALVLVGSGAVAWLAARPRRAFITLCCLLPLHVVVVAVLFAVVGLSETTTRIVAAWKEALVLVVFIALIVRLLTGRGGGARVVAMDLVVAALGAVVLGNLIGREPFVGTPIPLVGQLYGVRDSGLFLLLYFVGRSSGKEMAGEIIVNTIFAVGVALSIVAILERLFVPPEFLVAIGASKYFSDFLNLGVMLQTDELGLPMNYFTEIGGRQVARAGSTFLSSQAFAAAFLLIMPAATIAVLRRDRRVGLLRWVAYAIAWTGLLLTVTRMSIVCAVIETGLVAWYLHRRSAIVGVLAGFAAVLVMSIAVIPDFGAWLIDTLLFKTGSSTEHLVDWSNGIAAFVANPLGTGLATADATGDRFGAEHVTGDNLYLKYGVELGLPGLLPLLVILFGVGAAARTIARSGSTAPTRHFGVLVLAATVGIAINSVTSVVFTGQFVSYLYFWLSGATMTIVGTECADRVNRA